MKTSDPGDRLVALFLLGVLLFSPPLLSIFSADRVFLGVPVLVLFLFASWAGLIALVAMIGRAEPAERAEDGRAPADEE